MLERNGEDKKDATKNKLIVDKIGQRKKCKPQHNVVVLEMAMINKNKSRLKKNESDRRVAV